MREVAVKSKVREPLDELNRPPHVLGKRGPVRFYIQGDPSSCAGAEHFFDQNIGGSVVFKSGAQQNRAALESGISPTLSLLR